MGKSKRSGSNEASLVERDTPMAFRETPIEIEEVME